MYGTCGRIDNKADFDFFEFDLMSHLCSSVPCKDELLMLISFDIVTYFT